MNTTPYQAAKIVNAKLSEEGLKNIPPQMMYNYTSARVNAGKNPFIKFSIENGIDLEDLDRWTEKYIAKKKLANTSAE